MAKIIRVIIPLKGISKNERQVSVETTGFTGQSCVDATAAIEKAMGVTTADAPKDEMYHTERAIERVNVSDG